MRTRKLDAYAEHIKQAYLGGVGLALLAKAHGVSIGTIRNLLIRQGVSLRKPGRPQEKPNAF